MDLSGKDVFLTEVGLASGYLLSIAAITVGLVPMTPLRLKVAKGCFWGACGIFAGVALAWGFIADTPTFPRVPIVAALCVFAGCGAFAASKFLRPAGPSEPPIPKGQNDGGDSHGPGGAGGGGAGGRGGVAHGTGGGGGGGSALGGGGGGGGEGAPGGAGGIGGGGGGGGKGAPGGPGGPGAVVLSWTTEKPAPQPRTLYQAFQNDACAGGYIGRCDLVLDGPAGILKIEVNLAWGPNCGSTSLWFHVPETEDLYQALRIVIESYPEALGRLDMQRKLPNESGCVTAPKTSVEARFSGNIFIHSELPIAADCQKKLKADYEESRVFIRFRDAAYLAEQAKNLPSDEEKAPHSVVMMMVGDEAPAASHGKAMRSTVANAATAG